MKTYWILGIIVIVLALTQCGSEKVEEDVISSEKQAPVSSDAEYLSRGLDISLNAQSVLGKNLMKAIQEGGTEGALTFCNIQAIPLTDSTALASGVKIKRVSDRNRNPNNAANERELNYIQQAKAVLQEQGQVEPALFTDDGKKIGYYPIVTNALCLKCHGDPSSDINTPTLAAINTHYPNDKATGYGVNELRGIWVIEMDQ